METIRDVIEFVLHLNHHLNKLVDNFGPFWTYGILFAIVFCETGLVVTPFLPGDSLLFAVGALAASPGSPLDVHIMFFVLLAAAIIGDTVNYHLGKMLGEKMLQKKDSRIFKKEYIDRTHAFYEKYGGKTIILARFVPIVRTFAPFVAGVGEMTYRKFITYNIVGAIAWVGSLLYAGYFFGNMEIVKKNFGLVVIAIIIISILPGVFEFIKARNEAKKEAAEKPPQ